MSRSKQVIKQIGLSAILKGINFFLSLWLVPLTIQFLGQNVYGTWVTAITIVSWVGLMDIGFGHGFRNHLTEAVSLRDWEKANTIISTAYKAIGTLSTIALLIGLPVVCALNWQSILNNYKIKEWEYQIGMSILFITVINNFFWGLINQLFNAIQENAFTSLGQITLNTILIISLFITPEQIQNKILVYALIYLTGTLFSYGCLYLFFFKRNKQFKISNTSYNKIYAKKMFSVGGDFFIIQVAAIIIFSTTNILISHISGPDAVAQYNVVLRLFSSIGFIISLVIAPLWSAFTDAKVKNDFFWIRKQIFKLNIMMIPVTVLIIGCAFFSDFILKKWISPSFSATSLLIWTTAMFSLISIWNNIYAYYLNGITRTKEQKITSIWAMAINIPLSFFLGSTIGMGTAGIVLSSIICLLPFATIAPFVTYKTIK